MEWKTVRLGDYISIKSGLAYKGCHIGKGENLLLGMGCVSFKEKFVETGARPYNDPSDDRFVVSPGDIVLATRQQSDNLPILAMPAIIPNIYQNKRVLFGTNLYKIENNSEIDNRFLFWLLKHQHYVNYIAGVKSGTAVQMVTKKNVENYKFSCPPKFIRDKISKTLWDYDRLIENNTRRIRLLEQMAENLYKEWFVRFRFPEHENVEMVNGLPKGWERTVASSIIDVMSGGTPKTDHPEFYGGNIPFYTPKDANDSIFAYNTLTNITEEGLTHCNSQLYPRNTLIITARGTVGKLNLLAVPMAMNQSCFALQFKQKENPFFLYYAIRTEIAKLKKIANGGVFDTIVVKSFDHIKLIIPTRSLMDNFNLKVYSILEQVRNLSYQNQLLTRQRDLLLPRLMSGKLEVKS